MKTADMHKKSYAELNKHADKLRSKLIDKRQSVITTENKNVREIRAIRKELAQVLTISKQKSQSEEKTDE